jgi:hypothetical protein
MSTLPSTTAAEQELSTTVRHALAEDLKGLVKALRAGSLPNTDACLQQLRVVVSRVQSSVDLATVSEELSSNYTVEELETAYSLTRARVGLAVVDIKSAEVRNAKVENALHTQRKAEAAKAVGQSARPPTFLFVFGRVQPQPSTEPLQQQATADDGGGQSAVIAISDVGGGGRRCAVRSPKEGVAALTHAAEREEDDAHTGITRALEFDPPMSRVGYAAGLSMLCCCINTSNLHLSTSSTD